MELTSNGFEDGGRLDKRFAWANSDPVGNMTHQANLNPGLSWSDVPAGTQSFAIIVIDPDVPTSREDRNKPGRTIPSSLPRRELCHWVLIDLPSSVTSIDEGQFSDGVTLGGKDGPAAPLGSRQGINDFTGFMSANPETAGNYFGYDGPAPPGNDEINHRYVFTLYALDIPRLPVEGIFGPSDVLAAMDGHVLATASIAGIYYLSL